MLRMIGLALILVGCGTVETQVKTVPGVPVYKIANGLFGVDLKIDGQVIKNVFLDTGSANTIIAPDLLNPAYSSIGSFQMQYVTFSSKVSVYPALVEIFGQTIDTDVGIFEQEGMGSVLGLGYSAQTVKFPGEAPYASLVDEVFTLNLCKGNGGFLVNGTASASMNYTKMDSTNHIAVKPTSLNGVAFPTVGNITLLDSGTNAFIYLPKSVLAGLAAKYPNLPTGAWVYGQAYLTPEQAATLEPLSFSFEGLDGQEFTVSIPVSQYTVNTDKGIAILTTPAIKIGFSTNASILSTVFMESHIFTFDKTNKTVGIGSNDSLCD